MSAPLSRRAALAAAAALPAAALPLTVPAARAQEAAAATGPAAPLRRFRLGDLTVTTLLDGSLPREGAKEIFGGGATDEAFAEVSRENFISPDTAQFFFTPTLVETGDARILFDTGLGQGGLQAALSAAGVAPGDITTVVITHMHPDHIGGLMQDGAPVFANAAYVTGQAEYDYWAGVEPGHRVGDLFAKNMKPLAEKTSFLDDGGSVAPGITAMASFGHTPGHMGYLLDSGGQQLLLTADLANHYVWSFAHPEWEVQFDMDKAAATVSRRRVLGMLAAERMPMIGYHMPFPAAGFVEARGEGFRFVPVGYQMMG
ncbi:MBL fold metallo-hydrolase [Cribrihabitans pelagius]|uniref:MBL fold metallo-hydrolase n=1 Tax=Cribrihabitans pelagius TaxID=1765746 RepID=UPI003B5C0C48